MNDIITDLLAIIGVVLNGLPQGLLDRLQLVKLQPQGNAEARFKMNGVKKIYFYCNHSGLYYRDLMKGIDDRTVSIVASMDEEKYISNFASADFTIADGSLKIIVYLKAQQTVFPLRT